MTCLSDPSLKIRKSPPLRHGHTLVWSFLIGKRLSQFSEVEGGLTRGAFWPWV